MIAYPVTREDLEAARRVQPENPLFSKRYVFTRFGVFTRLEAEARELHAAVSAALEA